MIIDEITREAEVPVPPARAWAQFVAGFALWWPRDHCFCGEAALDRVFIDPDAGFWGEVTTAGQTRAWGVVLDARPAHALSLAWQMDASISPWQSVPDPERASRIDVAFTPSALGTRVILRHHGFARQGEPAASAMRAVIIGLDRWGEWLPLFAASLRR
jgi:uncharacterized protein YndB with AHSA1/START domain